MDGDQGGMGGGWDTTTEGDTEGAVEGDTSDALFRKWREGVMDNKDDLAAMFATIQAMLSTPPNYHRLSLHQSNTKKTAISPRKLKARRKDQLQRCARKIQRDNGGKG